MALNLGFEPIDSTQTSGCSIAAAQSTYDRVNGTPPASRDAPLTIVTRQIRFTPMMKAFVAVCIILVSSIAASAQSGQSPLAPPKVPAASPSGTSLKVGVKAPDFALPNGDGKIVVLSEYTQKSPVVLVFYRGFW